MSKCTAMLDVETQCEREDIHGIHKSHGPRSINRFVTWEGTAATDNVINVRYWQREDGKDVEWATGWIARLSDAPLTDRKPGDAGSMPHPGVFDVSRDGQTITWQGKRYTLADACPNHWAHKPLTLTFTGRPEENTYPTSYHFDGGTHPAHWAINPEDIPLVDRAVMIAFCKELIKRLEA